MLNLIIEITIKMISLKDYRVFFKHIVFRCLKVTVVGILNFMDLEVSEWDFFSFNVLNFLYPN